LVATFIHVSQYELSNVAYFLDEEREIFDEFPTLLKNVKVFFDVGASIGQYTFHADKHIECGKILAFEPDPIRYEKLRENCRSWQKRSSNTLYVFETAISERKGKEKMYITDSTISGSFFKPERKKSREIIVKTRALDDFEKLGPDFIKIDVEGAELRVLKGATKTLKRGKSKFLIEIHRKNGVTKFMEQFGYKMIKSWGPRQLFGSMKNEE